MFRNILDTYAYSDDYEFILNAGNNNFLNVFIQGGRLFYGVLNKILYTYFDSIELVKFIRLGSFFGGILLLFSLYKLFRYYGIETIYSLGIILLFAASPSFNIIIIWSLAYQISWALLLTLLAGFIIAEYPSKWAISLSIIIGVIALNLYQPAYTMFIIPIFIKWLRDKNHHALLKPLLVHLTTYIIYFITFKFYLSGFELLPLDRGGIDYNIWNSLVTFINDPFEQVLRYNLIFAAKFWLYVSKVFVFVLILLVYLNKDDLYLKNLKQNKILYFLIIPCFFILSMLPNIVSIDKWASFRTMNVLSLLVVIHIVFAIRKLVESNKYALQKYVIPALVLGALISANYNVNHGFIDIQKKELKVMSSLVRQVNDSTERILVVPPEMEILKQNNYVKRVVTDEFGRLSNSSAWVPKPFINLLVKENLNREIEVEFYNGQKLRENDLLFDIGKEYLRQND
ncbi:MAG TPA: hypothetical protein PKL31_12025 [Fulvivirga sp.]|nr:hypothetical protein [Fulvivirga sp.]